MIWFLVLFLFGFSLFFVVWRLVFGFVFFFWFVFLVLVLVWFGFGFGLVWKGYLVIFSVFFFVRGFYLFRVKGLRGSFLLRIFGLR